jgi:hypothetical protein
LEHETGKEEQTELAFVYLHMKRKKATNKIEDVKFMVTETWLMKY